MTNFITLLSSISIGVLVSFLSIPVYATLEHSSDKLESSASNEEEKMPKMSPLKRTSSSFSSTLPEKKPSVKKHKVDDRTVKTTGESTQFQKDFLATIEGAPEAEEKIYTHKKLTVEDERLIQEYLVKQNPHAQSLMGFLNLHGYENAEGKQIKNIVEAFLLSKLAADQGNVRSQYRVGIMMYNDLYYPYLAQFNTSIEEGVRYHILAADNGNKIAQCAVGDFYLRGVTNDFTPGVTPIWILSPDINKAIFYLTLAANQDVEEAQLGLGTLYKNGAYSIDGTVLLEPNPDLAIYYLSKNQDCQALYELGMMFKQGVYKQDGTMLLEPNPELAIHFLTLSAKKNSSEAVEALWDLFRDGISLQDGTVLLTQNPDQGIEVLTTLASEGNENAKYELGVIHWSGWEKKDKTVVPPSFRKSFNYFYESKLIEEYELENLSDYFEGNNNYASQDVPCVPPLGQNFIIEKINKINFFITEDPRWKMDFSRLTSQERAELLTDKSADINKESSLYIGEKKEEISMAQKINNLPEKEEFIVKETILSHFAYKCAALSAGNPIKRVSQYRKENMQEFERKNKLYFKALNCVTDLQDISLLKFVFEADCFVKLPSSLANKLMHDLPIFTSARNLDPITEEDQIRVYDINGTRYLTLGNDSIKKVNRFMESIETLQELKMHYQARYNSLSQMEKSHKENLKVLQSSSYSKAFSSTIRDQKILEEKGFFQAFSQKAKKALNKAEDLQKLENLIKENLEAAQPRKRKLLRAANTFIGPLGEEEE
ncbi:MAG: sel1 repeat family protein [Alphaproteobacteria bacterium]|nr:sel1 repeat family protein [Alphaproteobacteria bacterium]